MMQKKHNCQVIIIIIKHKIIIIILLIFLTIKLCHGERERERERCILYIYMTAAEQKVRNALKNKTNIIKLVSPNIPVQVIF